MGKKKAAAGAKGRAAVKAPSGSDTVSLAALRQAAEARLNQQLHRLDELSRNDVKELVHELGTAQIELEMQNEELRRAQTELEESRRAYTDLYDFAPAGYLTVDPQGAILAVNLTGAAMFGKSRAGLLKTPFYLLVRKEERDSFYLHLRQVLEKAGPQSCELTLTGKAGALFPAALESVAVRTGNGNATEIRIVVSDITERRQAGETLRQERALLAAVMDATDVMLVYLDAEFNFVWVNAAYAATCRMRPEDMVGKNHFSLYPHPENEAIFRRVRDTGEPVFFKDKPFEFPDQPERGVTYWDWSLVPVKDQTGRVVGLVFSLRETTKYKVAELALAESEARFRRIAEASPDAIFQLDPQGMITYSSEAMDAFGRTPEEVLGRPFAEFLPLEELPKAMAAMAQLSAGEKISLFETRVMKADGALADLEVNAVPIIQEDGTFAGIQGIARDITARKHTEAALKTSMGRFALLARTASELLQAVDLQPAMESACRQVMKHLGCDVCCNFLAGEQSDRYGLNVSIGVPEQEVEADDCPLSIAAVSGQVAADGRPVVAGNRTAAPRGMEPATACGLKAYACHPLLGLGGRVLGTLFFGSRHRESFQQHDLFLMKAVADQLAAAVIRARGEQSQRRQSLELAETNRELEAFSYTVSHDLRAPLRVIEGFSTAIIEDYADSLAEGAREYLAKVVAASRRMDQLIAAMLEMARLTKGEMKEGSVNLTSMVEVAAHELDLANPEHRVQCTVAGGVTARGDFDLLRIVIENLMSNVWKFTSRTDKPRVEFGVKQMRLEGRGTQPVYFVRDNGAGFDMTYADKLFKPFQRLHAEAEFPGLGIGLATVKKIITRHGGRVWAEAEPGKGASFYFTLGAGGGADGTGEPVKG